MKLIIIGTLSCKEGRQYLTDLSETNLEYVLLDADSECDFNKVVSVISRYNVSAMPCVILLDSSNRYINTLYGINTKEQIQNFLTSNEQTQNNSVGSNI